MEIADVASLTADARAQNLRNHFRRPQSRISMSTANLTIVGPIVGIVVGILMASRSPSWLERFGWGASAIGATFALFFVVAMKETEELSTNFTRVFIITCPALTMGGVLLAVLGMRRRMK